MRRLLEWRDRIFDGFSAALRDQTWFCSTVLLAIVGTMCVVLSVLTFRTLWKVDGRKGRFDNPFRHRTTTAVIGGSSKEPRIVARSRWNRN